jgi:glycosyltransferase involved in cell wall biosynthesis
MRVLHVIPGLSVAQGGLQSALIGICRAQRAAGIDPVIAALEEGDPPDAALNDFEAHLFRCDFRPTGASRAMKGWLADNAGGFEAVIAHSIWRDPLLYAAQAQAPLYIVAHGMLDPQALAHRAWRKQWRLRARLPRVLRRATLIYTCDAERQRARRGPGGEAAASAVIPLSVEVPATPAPLSDGPIVALGRIHPRKGLLEWVNALAVLADRGVEFRAVHAGPVEDQRYARRVYQAARNLSDRLEFQGALPHSRARELLAGAGLVAAPCAVAENFGMVIAEALAAARPVVAGRKALMVPDLEAAGALRGTELNAAAFAAAMREMLQRPEDARALALQGYRWAASHLAPDVVGAKWRKLLRSSRTA